MPLRGYRCENGHEIEVFEGMTERLKHCPKAVGEYEDGTPGSQNGPRARPTCGAPVEPLIQRTQRGIVKGGTPTHHVGQRPSDPEVSEATVRGVKGM